MTRGRRRKMSKQLKKGDKVKVVRLVPDTPMVEADLNVVYVVRRKSTDRWNGREWVDIRLSQREGVSDWNLSVRVPIEDVIKVNTKMYELRNKLVGGEEK